MNYLRTEPAVIAGVISIIITLVLTLTHNDPLAATVCSAVEAIAALVVRSQVTPTAKQPVTLVP